MYNITLTENQMGHLMGALEDSLEGLYDLAVNNIGEAGFLDHRADYLGIKDVYEAVLHQENDQSPDGLKYVAITLKDNDDE